jgi:4-hydroxy-3-methylbut-2-enyl diphosphate reductase
MGVRRAVDLAEAELGRTPLADVYSCGPLIHNPQTLASLEKRGLVILDEDSPVPGARAAPAIIIRAHGVSPGVEADLRSRGFRIVDATCPRVKVSQNTARALAEEGRCVFIAGEKNHAEVKGIAGYVDAGLPGGKDGGCVIVGNAAEAGQAASSLFRRHPGAKTALIAQTTISEEEYAAIAEALKKHFPGMEVKNTICGATRERQDALRKLCGEVDAVVVAGSRESANTRRLLSIARDCGKPAWLAESAADLPPAEPPPFKKYGVVGLCAGASTPDDVVEEIFRALENIPNDGVYSYNAYSD